MLRRFSILTAAVSVAMFFGMLGGLCLLNVGSAQPVHPGAKVVDAPKAVKKNPRGHKLPSKEVSAHRHRVSNARYGHILRALPVANQVAYDAYTAPGGSVIPPIGDQGQCGDCYMWSGMKVCSAAQMTAGIVKAGSGFMLSVQWGLDNHPELGGCDGGDEWQVAQTIQSDGAPSLAQYPGAGQNPGRPIPTTGMTLYSTASLVYCDPTQQSQGVASTQSIKNCILAYGYVSVAVAAGNDWDSYGPGQTLTGTSNQIDHAVGATGWDDAHDNGDGTKGAFLLDNQWGTSWGNNGRGWIKYGAESFGTEAFVALVNAPPPPPPTPVPPGPTPVPPTPVPTGSAFSITTAAGDVITIDPVALTVTYPPTWTGSGGSSVDAILKAAFADPKVMAAMDAAQKRMGAGPFSGLLVKIMAAVIPVVVADLAAGKTPKAIIADVVSAILAALVPVGEVPAPMPKDKAGMLEVPSWALAA